MNNDTPNAETGRTSRRVRLLLIGSLAFNLLIIGAIIGAVGRHGPGGAPGRMAGPLGPFGLAIYAPAMTRADVRAMHGALYADREAIRAGRAAVDGQIAKLAEAIRAEPFDQAQVAAALAGQRAIAGNLIDRGHAALVQRIAGMSAAERTAFADRLETRRKRRR